MSEQAEKFLAIKTYEEFDRRREELRGLSIEEPGVLEHFKTIFNGPVDVGYKDGIIYEVF